MISFVICNLSNFLCFGQFDAVFHFFRLTCHTSDDTGDPRRRGSITRASIVKRERNRNLFFNEGVKGGTKTMGNKKERKKGRKERGESVEEQME